MADNDTKPGENKGNLKQTISKHKMAFGLAIVGVVVVVIFLWSRNNNAQSNPNQLTGSNSLVPSAVAVPGPAGPTGPTGSRGPRGKRGPKGPDHDKKRHKRKPRHHHCPPGMHWNAERHRCEIHRPLTTSNIKPPAHMLPLHTAGLPAIPNHATFHPQNPAARR